MNNSKSRKTIPVFVYFLSAAFCFGAAGQACQRLSEGYPVGEPSASGVGASLGFVVFAIYLISRGFEAHDKEC